MAHTEKQIPRVSVIMGVFNSKRKNLLRQSIESILNQTFNDFEFIICDDCSTDKEVLQILDEYAEVDSRIIVIHNEKNSGLAASLNNCIEIAKGEYIARQDDDDISHPDRLQIEVEFLDENTQYAIVGCNLLLFDDNGIWGERKHTEIPGKKDFIYGSQFAHPATLIRRDILNKIGNYLVSKITRRTEDYELYMRLYAHGYVGYNLQMFLYDYYESSITYKQQKFKYRIDEFRVRYRGFKSLGLLPKYFIYCFKPIISGLTPKWIKKRAKRKKYGVG